MTKYIIEMNRFCKFCHGAKGYCSFFDIMAKNRSCMGSLEMRPEWCPLSEVKDNENKTTKL